MGLPRLSSATVTRSYHTEAPRLRPTLSQVWCRCLVAEEFDCFEAARRLVCSVSVCSRT